MPIAFNNVFIAYNNVLLLITMPLLLQEITNPPAVLKFRLKFGNLQTHSRISGNLLFFQKSS